MALILKNTTLAEIISIKVNRSYTCNPMETDISHDNLQFMTINSYGLKTSFKL